MMSGIPPEQATAWVNALAKAHTPAPKKPNKLVSREVNEPEEFKWQPGSTRETRYLHFENGKTISVERFRGYDGYIRVTAIELAKDGTAGVKRHEFDNEGN